MTTEPPDARGRETPAPENGRRVFRGLLRKPRLRSIALAAGFLVTVPVAVYLWTSGEEPDRPAVEAPERGLACPDLREAFEQSEAGNEEALRRSVHAAARAGEQALDRSGQVFGRPEEIALELEYALTKEGGKASRDVARFMGEAEKACKRQGRWAG